MAKIYNSTLTKELVDVGKIQTSRDKIPDELAEKIVPVINVNPKHARITNYFISANKTSSGTLTVATTPTDREIYLTSAQIGIVKDAACDNANGAYEISVIVNGKTNYIIGVPVLTLTAQQISNTITFINPIKIDKGTNILIGGTFTAGNLIRYGCLSGFTIENYNA